MDKSFANNKSNYYLGNSLASNTNNRRLTLNQGAYSNMNNHNYNNNNQTSKIKT
jgi:hypothetical protein